MHIAWRADNVRRLLYYRWLQLSRAAFR